MKTKPEFLNILHISDLQAGKKCLAERKRKGRRKSKAQIYDDYARYALLIANDISRKLKLKPHALVFTGDITERGDTEEFKRAKFFLTSLVGALGLNLANVLLIPGNHDVDRIALKRAYRNKRPYGRLDTATCAAMTVKMQAFKKFFKQFYEGTTDYKYYMGKPIHFKHFRRKDIMFVGLDTCEGLTYRDEENQGFVSEKQIQMAVELFKTKGRGKLKVVLMHHNPFPVPEEPSEEQTGLRNPDEVISALMSTGVTLVLAGHMHCARKVIHTTLGQDNADVYPNTLITGPCCMQHEGRVFCIDEGKEILPNRYEILSLNPSTNVINMWFRKFSFEYRAAIDGRHGDWTSDTDIPYADSHGRRTIHLDSSKPNRHNWENLFGPIRHGLISALNDPDIRDHITRSVKK